MLTESTDSDSCFEPHSNQESFTVAGSLHPVEGASGSTCNVFSTRVRGKRFFVKRLKPERESDMRLRAAFEKENELGLDLDHPALPRYAVLEGYSPDLFVVTEWIDGDTLEDFISNNTSYFDKKEHVVKFLMQLIDAIDYLHSRQITHNDLKPGNIMITRVGRNLKLVDLGYSTTGSHDLTGGFTPSFSSNGLTAPTDNAKADGTGDYYSLGRIIEYLSGINRKGFSGKMLKAAHGLTDVDAARREESYERLKLLLERESGKISGISVKIAWQMWVISIGAIAAFLVIYLLSRGKNDATPVNNTTVHVESSTPGGPELRGISLKEAEKKELSNLIAGKAEESLTAMVDSIKAFELNNDYSMDALEYIDKLQADVMQQCIDYRLYTVTYPELDSYEISLITSGVYHETYEKIYREAYDRYVSKVLL